MGMGRCIEPKEMSSSTFKRFCKTAACPSSEKLLDHHRHRLPLYDRAAIEIHLGSCDFCSAELQLLKCYRAGESACRMVEMPLGFRRLAEDLLKNTTRGFVGPGLLKTRQWSHRNSEAGTLFMLGQFNCKSASLSKG